MMGIVSLGAAAQATEPAAWGPVRALRDRLEAVISERIPGVQINGAGAARVAQTTNLNFEGVVGDGLVIALDLAGIAVSSGSACSSGVLEPSHVLLALGRSKAEATGAVRVSLTRETQWEDLAWFVDELERIVTRIRSARRPEVTL